MKIIYFTLFCSLFSLKVLSQDFGLSTNFTQNSHSVNFQKFPGVPNCCPRFESGSGQNINYGLFYQFPIFSNFKIKIGFEYNNFDGVLTKNETIEIIRNARDEEGIFTHTVDSKTSALGLPIQINYNFFSNFNILSGVTLNYINKSTYSQNEKITSPSDEGTFIDANGNDTYSRMRNVNSGDITSISKFLPVLNVGLNYAFFINSKKTLSLVPELSYNLPLLKLSNDLDWRLQQYKVALSFVYSPSFVNEEYYYKELIDTIKLNSKLPTITGYYIGKDSVYNEVKSLNNEKLIINNKTLKRTDTLYTYEKPLLNGSDLEASSANDFFKDRFKLNPNFNVTLVVKGLDDDGKESAKLKIKVEEFSSLLMNPLLNYVFFDENSYELPKRYNAISDEQTNVFDEKKINNSDKLATYYHLLNIVGSRLRNNLDANLTLTGCNQNIRGEKENKDLSRKRAVTVKNYLTKVWKINENRIFIKERNLPEKPSSSKTEEGNAEHRRVEIYSNKSEIIAPLITPDTLRTANPPTARFVTYLNTKTTIKNWNLEIFQNRNILKRFDGESKLPNIIDWKLNDNQNSIPKFDKKLDFVLKVYNTLGDSAYFRNEIPIENISLKWKSIEKINDKVIDRYSLILFDINSSEIKENNKFIVDFIRKRIKDNSEFEITGYTDKLGNPQSNLKLSEDRAIKTAKTLDVATKAKILGLASNKIICDNSLPEGRFYSRTVYIIVSTPIKETK